jgi:hypothetical protein
MEQDSVSKIIIKKKKKQKRASLYQGAMHPTLRAYFWSFATCFAGFGFFPGLNSGPFFATL